MSAQRADFERLVRCHGPALARFCRSLAGPSDGDDLLQDTLTRAMVGFGTLRDEERFLPWCRQIARNANVARLRSSRPTEPLDGVDGEHEFEAALVDELALRAELDRILAEMPDRSRHVLRARAEGVSPAALAATYGVSRTLVDTWFARARTQARTLIRNGGGLLSLPLVRLGGWLQRHRGSGQIAAAAVVCLGVGAGVLLTVPRPRATPQPVTRGVLVGRRGRPSPVRAVTPPVASAPAGRPSASVHPRSRARPTVVRAVPPDALRYAPGGELRRAAETAPIVIGPLLPGQDVTIGYDPCGVFAGPLHCPPLLQGLRLHLLDLR